MLLAVRINRYRIGVLEPKELGATFMYSTRLRTVRSSPIPVYELVRWMYVLHSARAAKEDTMLRASQPLFPACSSAILTRLHTDTQVLASAAD